MLEVSSVDGRPALSGELDLGTAPALKAWLENCSATEIDLSGVTFFDSTTLRIFLLARQRNPCIRVVNPSKAVTKVLQITGTLDYLLHGPETHH